MATLEAMMKMHTRVLLVLITLWTTLDVSAIGMQPEKMRGEGATRGALLDLNSANAGDLAALPGMGRVYARRVVEARPYFAKNQLTTRGVLPAATYDRIKDLVVAHHSAEH